ncbi:hypothetical protein PI125_g19008 [Phytophthora idaei]|nr:hypothetical protein PI125_g19008 [Phytophthora idaei]
MAIGGSVSSQQENDWTEARVALCVAIFGLRHVSDNTPLVSTFHDPANADLRVRLSRLLIPAAQAGHLNESLFNDTSSGSEFHEGNEAGIGSVVKYNTLVADWEACFDEVACENETSVCVRHSLYYAQCKPAALPSGDLRGQSDGTNKWLYDRCPADEKCNKKGKDFHCIKSGKQRHLTYRGQTTVYPSQSEALTVVYTSVGDWEDCTKAGTMCKSSTTTCVNNSIYSSQCTPAALPNGALCGQSDGTNEWMFDHFTNGETCKAKAVVCSSL